MRGDAAPVNDPPEWPLHMSLPSNHIDLTSVTGPRSRWKKFLGAINLARKLVRGFRRVHVVGPCVAIFGSADAWKATPTTTRPATWLGASVV